ncbi:hypothetical protein CR513_50501, partial [Mucuna pruriens]
MLLRMMFLFSPICHWRGKGNSRKDWTEDEKKKEFLIVNLAKKCDILYYLLMGALVRFDNQKYQTLQNPEA